jgi:hypothetical protein
MFDPSRDHQQSRSSQGIFGMFAEGRANYVPNAVKARPLIYPVGEHAVRCGDDPLIRGRRRACPSPTPAPNAVQLRAPDCGVRAKAPGVSRHTPLVQAETLLGSSFIGAAVRTMTPHRATTSYQRLSAKPTAVEVVTTNTTTNTSARGRGRRVVATMSTGCCWVKVNRRSRCPRPVRGR